MKKRIEPIALMVYIILVCVIVVLAALCFKMGQEIQSLNQTIQELEEYNKEQIIEITFTSLKNNCII